MMSDTVIIAGIAKGRNRQYVVTLSDGREYILTLDVISRNGLESGSVVTEDDLSGWILESEMETAGSKALWLLGRRDYSKKELILKLSSYVSAEAAEATAGRLEELRAIDDERYARRLAEDYMERRRFGEKRAILELTRRGIDIDTAKRAVLAFESDPADSIEELLNNKFHSRLSDDKGVKQTFNALVRMGYQYDYIRIVMMKYLDGHEYE